MTNPTAKNNLMSETLLGIDFGERNIGVALGKNGLVQPLRVVEGKNIQFGAQEISKIAIQNKVDKFIVGLPLSIDGKETLESREVRKFAKLIKVICKKPLEFQNEFNTSKEALGAAIELGNGKKSRQTNDHLAAGIILKRYYSKLEEQNV